MLNYIGVSLIIIKTLICHVDSYETSFKFVNPQQDTKLVGYELYQIDLLTEIKCLMNCAANNKCHSINHHEENQICILNKHEPSTSINEGESPSFDVPADSFFIKNGWKFFKKAEVRYS